MNSVIVFGPTGNVGSIAALTAEQKGAKVWLAMRDTSKAIPGLSSDRERSGRFDRVHADATKPDTLIEAVRTSGAKRAFIYLAHRSGDHMKGALEALRSAGIEFVVFLSSFTINAERPEDIAPSEVIPYIHAQVEVSLTEVFGQDNFVAVRPGGFATNLLAYKAGIQTGEVSMWGSGWENDLVTPIDMGQISGTILAKGPQNGQHIVYVYGPEIMKQGDAVRRVAKALGKDVKIRDMSAQETAEDYTKSGIPKPLSDYLLKAYGRSSHEAAENRVRYEEGVKNVEEYLGRPATSLEEWVTANKDMFDA